MKPEKIIRVVFYIRVSTNEQKLHGLSLDAQRMKLEEFAKKNNYKIVGIYVDDGVSGRKLIKNRPKLQEMLKDAEQDMFDLIAFIKIDRYFRSVAEYHECQKKLDNHNVKWTATEEKYDLTTANGRAFVNMKLTIAELEADQTSERIKLVNEYKLKQGYALSGAVPFGFKVVKKDNHSKVVINQDVKAIVYDFLSYYELYHSIYKAIERVNTEHNTNITRKVFRSTLSSPFLYGSYRDKDNYCEAYITEERYNKIQDMIQNNIKESHTKRIYLFSNLVTCGNCGTRMTGNYTTPYDKKEFYNYRCNSVSLTIKCNKRLSISEIILEKYLLDNIQKELEKFLLQADIENDVSKKDKAIDVLSITNEMDRLNIMFRKSRISEVDYDKDYAKLEKKLKEAKDVKGKKPKNLEPLKRIINGNLLEIYNVLDREHKRSFWQSIIKEIVFYSKDNISIHFKAF